MVRLFESVATVLLTICIGLVSVQAVASPQNQFNNLASAIHGARFGGQATPPPTLSITTSTVSATVGTEFTLSWSSNHADSCMASGSWEGVRPPSGTEAIAGAVAGVNTYVLTCSGAGGERSARITVEITGDIESLWDYRKVAYGTEDPDRQWLNIRLAYDQARPAPVYLFAHGNGGTAYGMSEKELHTIASAGYTTISWESIPFITTEAEFFTAVADAQLMFDWVIANADTYNIDPDHIVVGGRSRGSGISWQLAHSNHPSIRGIYMYNALPEPFWQSQAWSPVDEINSSSPTAYLVYGPDFDSKDIHNPVYADPVIERYDDLDIGDRMTRYVDMWGDFRENGNWTNDEGIMHYFPEFVATLEDSGTKPVTPSNALFIGHSFFAPIARQMPFHAALLGLDEYSQHVEFSGGETGQPLALWEDAEHRQNIQAVLDTGEVDTFGMTYGPDESGYQLWIDYALSKNPDTRFVLGIPWLDFPGDYDTAKYSSTYAEGIETLLSGQYGNLRALYPDVDIVFMPYGLAAVELRYALDAGQLPGVINLIGDNAATSLFKDQKGHGHKSGLLLDLAEFIWLDVIFGVDLEAYNYDSGHSIDLKETAQSIFDEYPHYFVE